MNFHHNDFDHALDCARALARALASTPCTFFEVDGHFELEDTFQELAHALNIALEPTGINGRPRYHNSQELCEELAVARAYTQDGMVETAHKALNYALEHFEAIANGLGYQTICIKDEPAPYLEAAE